MDTLERIKKLAATKLRLDTSQFTEHTALDDIGVDSLGLIEFLFVLEDEFHVRFPQERDALRTVGDLVAYVQSQQPAPTRTP